MNIQALGEEVKKAQSRLDGAVHTLSGTSVVSQALDSMMTGATSLCRALDRGPYMVSQPAPTPLQLVSMARGVAYQVLYEGSALRSQETLTNIRQSLEAGEDARVLPYLPFKLLIADSSQALLMFPRPGLEAEGLLVDPSPLLDELQDMFSLLWEMAVPAAAMVSAEIDPVAEGWSPQAQTLVRLMASGLDDDTICQALGLTHGELDWHISQLMAQLGAETRFHLAVVATRSGWL